LPNPTLKRQDVDMSRKKSMAKTYRDAKPAEIYQSEIKNGYLPIIQLSPKLAAAAQVPVE
jgi:hypothetical protein